MASASTSRPRYAGGLSANSWVQRARSSARDSGSRSSYVSTSIAGGSVDRCATARLPGVLGFCLGGLAGDDAVDPFAVGFLRSQRQPELPAHNAGKKAADRMLLPASRFHDRGDRYTLGLSEQGEDGRLLGPAAGRARGSFST